MKFSFPSIGLPFALLMGAGVVLGSVPAQALVFQFQFAKTGEGLPPIVGSGSFSFDGDPGIGTFPLDSLANYKFNFRFDWTGSYVFTNSAIATPTSEVLVVITGSPTLRDLKFSNINRLGSGPLRGSLDFFDFYHFYMLSFEPPWVGGNLDGFYFPESGRNDLGTYSAIYVPGPLPVMGVAAAFGWSRRLRRRIATSAPLLPSQGVDVAMK